MCSNDLLAFARTRAVPNAWYATYIGHHSDNATAFSKEVLCRCYGTGNECLIVHLHFRYPKARILVVGIVLCLFSYWYRLTSAPANKNVLSERIIKMKKKSLSFADAIARGRQVLSFVVFDVELVTVSRFCDRPFGTFFLRFMSHAT